MLVFVFVAIKNLSIYLSKYNPDVHHQNVALEVPEGDLVDSDILETSLYGFVMKSLHKIFIICKGLYGSRILLYTIRMLLSTSLRLT